MQDTVAVLPPVFGSGTHARINRAHVSLVDSVNVIFSVNRNASLN